MPRNQNCLWFAAIALVFAASSPAHGGSPRIFQMSQLPQSSYSGHVTPSSYGMRGNILADEPAANPSYSQGMQTPLGPATIYHSQAAPPCDCVPGYAPPPLSIIALAESTFFWPSISGVAVSNGIGSAGAGGPITNIGAGSNSLFLVAPRIALGVQGCQWGIVGRFWDAQTTTTNATNVEPAGVNATNIFHAYTADLELQRRFAWRRGTIWAFGGARYGSINYQQSFAATTITGTPDFVTSSAFGTSRFNGAGITFGAYGTHAIADTPFSLFASNRYSFLWGGGRSFTQAQAAVLAPGGSDAAADCDCGSDQADLFIAEVQLGVQWEHPLRWMPARVFLRTAAEYQYWSTGGIANRSITQTADVGNVVGTGSASAGDLILNMIGFNVGAGIIY